MRIRLLVSGCGYILAWPEHPENKKFCVKTIAHDEHAQNDHNQKNRVHRVLNRILHRAGAQPKLPCVVIRDPDAICRLTLVMF